MPRHHPISQRPSTWHFGSCGGTGQQWRWAYTYLCLVRLLTLQLSSLVLKNLFNIPFITTPAYQRQLLELAQDPWCSNPSYFDADRFRHHRLEDHSAFSILIWSGSVTLTSTSGIRDRVQSLIHCMSLLALFVAVFLHLLHSTFDDLLRLMALSANLCHIRKFPMACSLHLWPSRLRNRMSFFKLFLQVLTLLQTPAAILYWVTNSML